MRKTHPVNALKKLGIGLAFGAATIMSMPTSALACTQMYMGKNLTADGNTYYGRAEDYGKRYLKHFGIEDSHAPGFTYSSDESGFAYTSNKTTYRYSYVRDHPSQWDERWDAYSEAGINEKGVSCSATLSTSMNADVKAVDPLTNGLGEYSYASVILGESATAREGVELIGSLIDQQGVCSNDQIVIADSNETWLFAALSGHQWIAMKLADDVASLNPNIGSLNYDVDLDDTENCLHSKAIQSMPEEKGFAEYTDGKFDVAKTYGERLDETGRHQWTRYVQATRARDHADLAVGQTGLVEALGDHGAKLLDGIVQRCGGHFLRTDLKQEILSVCHGLRHLAFLVGILVDSGDLGHVGLAARLGDGADAQDVVGTLDRGQGATGIEQVESVAALHDTVVCGQRQLALQAGVALGLVVVKLLTHHLDVGDLKVIGTELALVLEEHVAIGHGRAVGQVAPHQVVDGVDALGIHGDALQAIGDLDGHGVDLDATHLLEVRKLRDLHAVEPDLPAKAPGAQGRALPVVLDKADVMVVGVQTDGGKRPQVKLLSVYRRRLDKHLELIVVLHAVGVLAVADVGRTAARLSVAGAPLGGTKRAQRGRGVEGTGTDLGVIGLHNDAALLAPVLLEAQDDVLEGKR